MIKRITPIIRIMSRVVTEARRQCGLGLVETLVAVAVLGSSVVAFIVSLSTGIIAINEYDNECIAQRLAKTQMEYTKSLPFNPGAITYPVITVPTGYTVTVSVDSVPGTDVNIQKIVVAVSGGGEGLLTVEGYKENR